MSSGPPPGGTTTQPAAPPENAVAVLSAYGAFRLLLVLLALWSFFAGFSMLTQGVGALSFGGEDDAAERVIGAHMIVLAPVYGLLAWRRNDYRLFIWVPYAAQLAIILPVLWERDFGDGALLLVVSVIFLALLIYVWWSSHPLDFFGAGADEAEPEEDDGAEDAGAGGEGAITAEERAARARRYRRM